MAIIKNLQTSLTNNIQKYYSKVNANRTNVSKLTFEGKLSFDLMGFNAITADINVNSPLLVIVNLMKKRLVPHESMHTEQFKGMAAYLVDCKKNIEEGLTEFKNLIVNKEPLGKIFEDDFNWDFYKKAVENIKTAKNFAEIIEKGKKDLEAYKAYPDRSLLFTILSIAEEKGSFAKIKKFFQLNKAYKNNPLEVEARQAYKKIS